MACSCGCQNRCGCNKTTTVIETYDTEEPCKGSAGAGALVGGTIGALMGGFPGLLIGAFAGAGMSQASCERRLKEERAG